ncbi:glycosyltransferase family 4 protein [Pedobacter sp. GR22-6]|uniref:glycosyltransferase family 4 protein n=1 Tax=Pedobacter sp. GR22-6 TaxID=3127957 RepID=UPI00307FA0C7
MPKELIILYEPQMFDLQNYGGITRYFANLVTGFNKMDKVAARLPLAISKNYYVRHFPQLFNNRLGRLLLKSRRKQIGINRLFSSIQIRKSDFDLLHATYYDPYFLKDLRKPLVITVHDMIHENYSNLYDDAEEVIAQKKQLIDAADLIIAISEYTKQELLRYYPQYETKTRVIYHGLPETGLKPASEKLPDQFLMYVGDRNAGYKNFETMISAIAPILVQNQALSFICTGGGTFTEAEANLFKELGIDDQLMQINAPDPLVKQLYMEALVFIYPSLEEGFGFPILEAFKNGCAVACSDQSCLPEVGGNAVAYFNPQSSESIQRTVKELIGDSELRNTYIDLGYVQLKKFTFENCLNQTLDAYQTLLRNTHEH